MSDYHKFPYRWTMKNTIFSKDKGKVFSCFSCGGGSTMGYKLAGFDVIGCNDIDPKMMDIYIKNHNPKYSFLESIRDFKHRNDIPEELFNLDILDGSPPCSSFSMAGNRDKDWGKEKKFREGQDYQILDTLFFDFISLANKLKPKVIIAENVKGLLIGKAKKYVNKILIAFENAGYYVDFKLINASKMGVPQNRERVFFYGIRKDLYRGEFADLFNTKPCLNLEFNESLIPYRSIRLECGNEDALGLSPSIKTLWEICDAGKGLDSVHSKGSFFNEYKLHPDKVIPTLRAKASPYDYMVERSMYNEEICLSGSFPTDYNFMQCKPIYVVGMSVPPVMTAQVAIRIHEHWLSKIKVN